MTTLADLATPPPTLHRPRPSEFLRSWFAGCPPDQLVELRAIRPTDHRVLQEWFTLDATDALYGRACALVEEFDTYFGVCPRIRPDGSKTSVTHAPGLWADLDFKRFADGEAGALRALAAFPVPVSWVVATGGGFHTYWKLATPARADRSLEGRLKAIAQTLHADPAATDTARVLRIPGTWHLRRDFHVRIVTWPSS